MNLPLLATEGFGLNLNLFETNVLNWAVVVFGLYKFLPGFLGKMLQKRREGILLELKDKLHLDVSTVTGKTLGQTIEETEFSWQQNIVKSAADPIYREGGMAVLKGNLAPNTAIIKQSAASDSLLTHSGRAVVFDGLEDLAHRIDSEELDVHKEDILVLRYIGPKGAPGMPEAGLIPIPK